MTIRAVTIGLLLGFFLAVGTYYNDFIIGQTLLIRNLLPGVVLGAMLLLALTINPVLGLINPRWLFGRGELAVIVAIGLAGSAWPDAAMYRQATTILAMPAHLHKTKASWQSAEVMSYVPGGSARLATGHVHDWPMLARRIVEAGEHEPGSPAGRIWHRLNAGRQHEFREAAQGSGFGPQTADAVRRGVNRAMSEGPLVEPTADPDDAWPARARELLAEAAERDLPQHEVVELNRWLLVGMYRELVLPPPRGDGVLLAGGRDDRDAVQTLVTGRPKNDQWGVRDIPWSTWWPTIRLWGGAVLLVGLATFCLALVVHPQWSRNELLPYPIARFVNESIHREPGDWLPKAARSRVFWWAFAIVAGIHLFNGLSLWLDWPAKARVPLSFDFNALRELFTYASRVPDARAYFAPTLFLSAAAFAFFLPSIVSFSIGIAPLLFVTLSAALLSMGVAADAEYLGAGKFTMLRFGAYVGFVLMIAYTGRRYYASVAGCALGVRRDAKLPSYVPWAARGLMLTTMGAVALLYTGGLGWGMATACILLLLMMYLVLTRIVAETGMFFVQSYWLPAAVLTSLLGFEAVGPTTYIVLALACTMIAGDTRTPLMPNLINALQIADRSGSSHASPRRVAPWLLVMIVGGFLVAGVVTLQLQYNYDIQRIDLFSREMLPEMPFDQLARFIGEAASTGTLAEATAHDSLFSRLGAVRFNRETWGWLVIGIGLFVGTAAARLRLPWWPLHPVAFVVWGTFPNNRYAAAFLIGWLIKLSVVRLGGTRSYSLLMPGAVGVIAAELLCNMLWLAVGAIYYFGTGQQPTNYSIF